MKSILIGGASRAGKTILARQLQQSGAYSLHNSDAMIAAFGSTFPDLGISHQKDHNNVCKAFFPFLKNYLKYLQAKTIVFDSFHLLPADVVQEQWQQTYQVLFLGYPNADPTKKMAEIRLQNPLYYGAAVMPDTVLGQKVNDMIAYSKKLQEDCRAFGLPFLDVSHDFEETIADAAQKILLTSSMREEF